MPHERTMKPEGCGAPRVRALRRVAMLGLVLALAGCASLDGGSSGSKDETLAEAIGAMPKRDASLASIPAASGPPKELPYPTFGAPKQIGTVPVMSPAETAKMQSDLEQLAKQREQQLLNDIEQSQ